MADIHPFSNQASAEAVKRLTEKLRSAFEAGEDLGPRASHINALAETLERTLADLDDEIQGLKSTMSSNEVEILLRDAGLANLREQIKNLITSARSFSNVV